MKKTIVVAFGPGRGLMFPYDDEAETPDIKLAIMDIDMNLEKVEEITPDLFAHIMLGVADFIRKLDERS